MDLVADSAYIKDGIKYTQRSEKCPPNSTLAWRSTFRFVIVSITSVGNYHVVMYDVTGVANYGMGYIMMVVLSMLLVVWPLMFLEMVIAQKHEANMLNSLGNVNPSLWVFGAIGGFLTFLNFICTHCVVTFNVVFALTSYTDWRGDDQLPELVQYLEQTGQIPRDVDSRVLAANPPMLICCTSNSNMTKAVTTLHT